MVHHRHLSSARVVEHRGDAGHILDAVAHRASGDINPLSPPPPPTVKEAAALQNSSLSCMPLTANVRPTVYKARAPHSVLSNLLARVITLIYVGVRGCTDEFAPCRVSLSHVVPREVISHLGCQLSIPARSKKVAAARPPNRRDGGGGGGGACVSAEELRGDGYARRQVTR